MNQLWKATQPDPVYEAYKAKMEKEIKASFRLQMDLLGVPPARSKSIPLDWYEKQIFSHKIK